MTANLNYDQMYCSFSDHSNVIHKLWPLSLVHMGEKIRHCLHDQHNYTAQTQTFPYTDLVPGKCLSVLT